jgi:hypothetical protein
MFMLSSICRGIAISDGMGELHIHGSLTIITPPRAKMEKVRGVSKTPYGDKVTLRHMHDIFL